MSTEVHDTRHEPAGPSDEKTPVCEGGTCQTGFCSPCLIIWGLAAVYFLISFIWEAFR